MTLETEILLHPIEYYFRNDSERELTESDEEHIKQMITEGYVEGELNSYDPETEEEFSGWWKIKRGENYAT